MPRNLPWTESQLPPAVRRLPPVVRRKVIEIAHELLRERMDEATAVRIATAKARAWALHQQRVREGISER